MGEKQNYFNPFYSPSYCQENPVLVPSTLPYNFKSVLPLMFARILTQVLNANALVVLLQVLEEHVPSV